MFLKHVDMESALRRLAERRIEEAMKEGKFDNLSGAGKPLELEPMPAEENARLMWWCIRILKQNDVTPDEIKFRKEIDVLREVLGVADSENDVRALVTQINLITHRLNTLGTNAIKSSHAPLDVETEIARYRLRVNGYKL